MEVDISDYVTRGVLSMECENGWWRLITYLSKSLNEIERNYEIHDKKMLAVIRESENWRHLLESAKFKFECYDLSLWVKQKTTFVLNNTKELNRVPSTN